MGYAHGFFRRRCWSQNSLAHRPEYGDLLFDGFVNRDRLRCGGRQLEQLIDDEFFDGQPVRQRPRRDCLPRELPQVPLKSRVLLLKQKFHPCILHKHPQVLDQPRMRIQTKQRRQGVRRNLFHMAILLAQGQDQVSERLKGQPIRPKLHVPRFVSRHYQIQTRILFSSGIATEERRQRDDAPVLAHRGPHRCLPAHRIGERLDRQIRSTEPLREKLHGTGHLPKRHTI